MMTFTINHTSCPRRSSVAGVPIPCQKLCKLAPFLCLTSEEVVLEGTYTTNHQKKSIHAIESGIIFKIIPKLTLFLIHCKKCSPSNLRFCSNMLLLLNIYSQRELSFSIIPGKTLCNGVLIFFKRIILGHFPDQHLAFS